MQCNEYVLFMLNNKVKERERDTNMGYVPWENNFISAKETFSLMEFNELLKAHVFFVCMSECFQKH
jgi:uncharacterized protein with ParB-like and HNH nuclease domain